MLLLGSLVSDDALNAQVRLSADLLGSDANRSLAAHLGPNGLSPPSSAARVLLLNNTQPLLSSGQLRWALNNVATYKTPSCLPTLAQARGPASMLAHSVNGADELAGAAHQPSPRSCGLDQQTFSPHAVLLFS